MIPKPRVNLNSIWVITILSLIALILITVECTAQNKYKLSATISIDPEMLINGASHDYKPGGSLDWEVKAQYNREKWRLGMAYKKHALIKFQKFTWIEFDWKFNNVIFENLTIYTGIELSDITRHYPDAHYSNPDNYIPILTTNFLPGLQGAIEYKILNGFIGLSLEGSIYKSEEKLRDLKPYRYDVTAQIIIYFFNGIHKTNSRN